MFVPRANPTPRRRDGESAARWMRVAARQIGAMEDVRKKHGEPAVSRYLAEQGFALEGGAPWCSVTVRWVLEQIGLPASRKLDTRSWLEWGEGCGARYGALAVFGDSDAEGQGHVGFYVGESRNCVYVLGGNTWSRGRYAPGVGIRAYNKARLLGYRWPGELRRPGRRRGVAAARLAAPLSATRRRAAALRQAGERLRDQLAQACEGAPQLLLGVLRQLG